MNLSPYTASLLPFTLLIVLLSSTANGFSPPTTRRCATELKLSATRRTFLTNTAAASTLSLLPLPAFAKEKVPITRELVTATFASIKEELTSPSGVVATLQKLIDDGNYEEILQYTKESDAFFRKGKLGKARKLLTDDKLKGDSVLMSNAVTFDLIGINRASRPGKENKEEQLRYLQELKADVKKFLELEGTIQIDD
ncbi:hypothetical protein ACHAWO_012103 [Cyclotella atomus]|uniref:Uncharacterized protein n=1 Tax=Cyclotella atomus TaxID=382360 RepID=A0ABD3NNK8_9STRA